MDPFFYSDFILKLKILNPSQFWLFFSLSGYDHDTGLLESVVTRSGHHFDMRMRMKYHGGLMKEMKIRFSGSSSPDFDNAIFRYQYDGNGRLAVMLSSVGTGNDHQHTGKFHSKAIFLHNECSLSTSTFLTFSHTFFEEIYNRGFLSCLKGGGEHSAYF